MASLKMSKLPVFWRKRDRIANVIYNNRNAICVLHYRNYSSQVLTGDTIRIGCASGFWGDTSVSVPQLIHGGKLDFLVFDYLSEITMSLLTAAKHKVPQLGYAPDFIQVAMAPFIKDIKNKGVRVISNAGGVNPVSCGEALRDVAKKNGVDLNIAVITGDDLMPRKAELDALGVTDMDSGLAFPTSMNSMNAYLGAGAIARALDRGADVVITGRCVDSAVTLAPLLHTFKWDMNNANLLAAGSLAGHLIECGAQATGGIFTDWHQVPDWHNIGFPIVECASDGDFILTKPPDTGGLVSKATVSEQLVYEIGDPRNYSLPDVVCDFSQVKISEIPGKEGQAVHVTGARGRLPTGKYKVSATYLDGYRATAVACIGGPESVEKGRKTARAILKRMRGIFQTLGFEDFTNTHVQMLGSEQTYGPHAKVGKGPRECVLWLAVHHQQKKALEMFVREISPAGTGMAPGLMGLVGGRPKVSPVLKLFSFLYPRDQIQVDIHMSGNHMESFEVPPVTSSQETAPVSPPTGQGQPVQRGPHTYRLEDLAYTRSGDKGNTVNIGVVARHPSYVPYLRQALTVDSVADYFSHLFDAKACSAENLVDRFELPGIEGFNFVLRNALGGGGIASLRSDPQGKALGQMLLDFPLQNMPLLETLS